MSDLSSSTVDNSQQECQVNKSTSGESDIAQSQSAHGEYNLNSYHLPGHYNLVCRLKTFEMQTFLQQYDCEETLEDLLSTLSQQIKSSDWLQLNTAEKFAEENPEVAQIFKDALNKYDSTADKD